MSLKETAYAAAVAAGVVALFMFIGWLPAGPRAPEFLGGPKKT